MVRCPICKVRYDSKRPEFVEKHKHKNKVIKKEYNEDELLNPMEYLYDLEKEEMKKDLREIY